MCHSRLGDGGLDGRNCLVVTIVGGGWDLGGGTSSTSRAAATQVVEEMDLGGASFRGRRRGRRLKCGKGCRICEQHERKEDL